MIDFPKRIVVPDISSAFLALDIEAVIDRVIPDWGKILGQLDVRERDALVLLGKRGWYMDSEFTYLYLFNIAEAIREDRINEADETLCDYYESRLSEIESALFSRHPHRERFLRDAILAHKEGKYTLSVPVFLTQADGICNELVGCRLYSRQKATGLQRLTDRFSSEFIAPTRASVAHVLWQLLPISAGQEQRANEPGLLYRHAVLHGEDLAYDTRIQSCRAISLLNCVSWVFLRDLLKQRLPE